MSLQLERQSYLTTNSIMPQKILDLYYLIEKEFSQRKKWKELSDRELWYELCLCILSSNVSFEQAKSAMIHLAKNNFLNPEWIENNDTALELISKELSKPICLPIKKDGSLRKYRFPNVRAKNLVMASHFFYSANNGLKNSLLDITSEFTLRNFLAENVSGLGLKEASHFLRNVGIGNSLAIIDVHIVSFLKELKLISDFSTITENKYYEFEEKMNQLANFYGLNLGILDNAIWNYMKYRNRK